MIIKKQQINKLCIFLFRLEIQQNNQISSNKEKQQKGNNILVYNSVRNTLTQINKLFGHSAFNLETSNTDQDTIDYCDAVAKDTSFKVNLTIPDKDNRTYCVEGGSHEALFDTIKQENHYVYLSEHYCSNLQNYPIICEYYHASDYDQKAKDNYNILYEGYKIPNSNGLGIARFVFFAEQFNQCNSNGGNTDYEICSFVCVIWQNRCPDYNDIYDRVCANGGGEDEICSYTINNSIQLFPILLLLY